MRALLVAVLAVTVACGAPVEPDPTDAGSGGGTATGGGAATGGGSATGGGGGSATGGGGGSATGGGGGSATGGGGGSATGGGGGSATGGGGGSATGGGGGSATGGGGGSATGGGGGATGGGGGATGVELNSGWIGGACTSAASCSDSGYTATASCELASFPNGFCTQACTVSSSSGNYICPDAATIGGTSGNTITRCVSAGGLPKCVAECDFNQSPTGCRPGYTCVLRERYNQSSSIFKVCMPDPGQRWPGETAPANDIGAACATDSSCAYKECLSTPGGMCTKTMCDYAGCPTGSECFGIGNGQTSCLKKCTQNSDCRQGEGYECDTQYRVCLPGSNRPTWDNTVGTSDCATAWGTNGSGLSPCDTTKDDYVVVHKSKRNLALCNRGAVVANFEIGLGFAPTGDKVQEGDGKTPEGVFYAASLLPNSQYYKAWLISYPDKGDATRGLSSVLITQSQATAINTAQDNCTVPPQTTQLGSYVEIHGRGGTSDWTLGCVAIADTGVDQVWATLGQNDTIVILP